MSAMPPPTETTIMMVVLEKWIPWLCEAGGGVGELSGRIGGGVTVAVGRGGRGGILPQPPVGVQVYKGSVSLRTSSSREGSWNYSSYSVRRAAPGTARYLSCGTDNISWVQQAVA